MKKHTVMIIDNQEECRKLSKAFEDMEQLEVVACCVDGEDAVETAVSCEPDVIVMDVILPECDGFDLLAKIRAEVPKTKFIMTSLLNSGFYINKAIQMGVFYYMIKPVDSISLSRRIIEVCTDVDRQNFNREKSLEEKITNIFITVGIPAHIKGYQFLREAIKIAVKNPQVINSITKKLYPSIADLYDTSASKVERAIRHAIEVAWDKGKIENINRVFGLKVYDTHEKPTNGEFIALVADKMLLEGGI